MEERRKRYVALITVDEAELDAVFAEMKEAEETIRRCYQKLEEMGYAVIVRKEDAASGN